MVVFANHAGHQFLLGATGAKLQSYVHNWPHIDWDSNAAELMGFCHAYLYVIDLFSQGIITSAVNVYIYYDSMYAANTSVGIWSTDKYPSLISIANHLYQIVKALVTVHPQHVPAHAGQPHNEAADSACSAIS
eukprot:1834934-Karenia_brevis.AAC.1